MPSNYIDQLPNISTIGAQDVLIIQQQLGAQQTTYQTTVEQLLGAFVPTPNISNTAWDSGAKELTIEGENLLPNTLIKVDERAYTISSYETIVQGDDGEVNKIIIGISSGLLAGSHTLTVENAFIKKTALNFTV